MTCFGNANNVNCENIFRAYTLNEQWRGLNKEVPWMQGYTGLKAWKNNKTLILLARLCQRNLVLSIILEAARIFLSLLIPLLLQLLVSRQMFGESQASSS